MKPPSGGCGKGLGIERIALRRGQQSAALLHGRAFDQRHIGRQPVAEPGVVRHAEAGPPDIAAGQMLQRIMVAGRAAEQAHALHARTRLAAPQEGDQGVPLGQRLDHGCSFLLHAPPEGVGSHTSPRAALDCLRQSPQPRALQCRRLGGGRGLVAGRRQAGGQPQREAPRFLRLTAGTGVSQGHTPGHQPLPSGSLRDPHQRLRAAIGPRQAAQVPALDILQVQGHALPLEFTLDHVAGGQIDAPGLAPTGSQDPCGRLARRQRARPCGQGLP